MKIYITKINRQKEDDIQYFKYHGKPFDISLAFWVELLEPRYLINKTAFKSLWYKYTGSEKEIIEDEKFNNDALIAIFNQYDIYKLESFLEKVWIKFKFIIRIK